MFTLLLVDDENSIRSSMQRILIKEGYRILSAKNGLEALGIVSETTVDLVVLDLKMPVMGGFEFLEKVREKDIALNVIIFTADGMVEDAVKGMKLGAIDYIEKSSSPNLIKHRIQRQYQLWKLQNENHQLKQQIDQSFTYEPMLGESRAMKRLKEMIVRVSPTDTTVLIQGESGVGKELVAKAIHQHSLRRDKPFIVVDCAALSDDIIESELFGHVRGAFTGAQDKKKGLFRAADGGTLFFDELGELPLKAQAKLLRSLQERQVRPVGSEETHQVDVRVLAATNRNLYDEVAKSQFRNDLYYRFSSVTLSVPPLREREGDISLLSGHFIDKLKPANHNKMRLDQNVSDTFAGYQWPGNVRELENTIRGLVTFADSDIIDASILPPQFSGPVQQATIQDGPVTMQDYEKLAITNALTQCEGNRRKAAEQLEISEATLYRKIKEFDL